MPPGDWKWLALAIAFLMVWWLLRPPHSWLDEAKVENAVAFAGFFTRHFILPALGLIGLLLVLGYVLKGG